MYGISWCFWPMLSYRICISAEANCNAHASPHKQEWKNTEVRNVAQTLGERVKQYDVRVRSKLLKKKVRVACLTLYVLNFSEGTKRIFTFYVIPPHWHDTGSWNPSSSMTRTYIIYIVNIRVANVLATRGARATANRIFPMFDQINLVPAR